MKVLFVEDSKRLQTAVGKGLRKSGFAVDIAGDGKDGLYLAEINDYDVIVLDLMLPGIDGLTILKELRRQGKDVHILLLTAKYTVEDRVRGLQLGADDYLTKPFAFDELLARIQALIRRRYNARNPLIQIGSFQVNTAVKTLALHGQNIPLSPREYMLLEFMAVRKGTLVTRAEIEQHIYDERINPNSNVVDSAICKLRKKLNLPGGPEIIHTRRGLGYLMTDNSE
ncbi:transcriptional activator protein CzcR [bacterium BMS3Abin09]|nr:transcriptional activator protein CzcR [bacterium BMS3Abin09]GBE41879.1 transcriptional activator protein CzcR [bacterium BMS3Bbin09]